MLETFSSVGFRNLEPQTLFFPDGITLLLGENGVGKTNVLEGIALLVGRSSFRQARLSDMARGEGFRLAGAVCGAGGREEIQLFWEKGHSRAFRRNGGPAAAGEMGEVLPAVFLAPEDRGLFEGPPAGRRRFLDRLAIGLFPLAHEEYSRFHRAMAQRNALLAAGVRSDEDLDTWTEEFLRCAVRVAKRRRAALELWQSHFSRIFRAAGPLSGLRLLYRSETAAGDPAELYRRQATALRRQEKARGHTLFGPQRDELEFRRDGRLFALSASSGEIKKAAFLLRISEGEAVAAQRGILPLYALDDFDADLSPAAAESLLSVVPPAAQMLLTSARPEAVSFCPRHPDCLYEIIAGRAVPEGKREYLRKTG